MPNCKQMDNQNERIHNNEDINNSNHNIYSTDGTGNVPLEADIVVIIICKKAIQIHFL